GEANIGNFAGVSGGVTYNGIIYASAALEFYPASDAQGAPRTPDLVVPVNGPGGDAGTLGSSTSQITQTLTLPTNVERAYLDVIAQSQSNDEFWYFCVPSDQATNLESCGNTPFRETEVTIDGQPAGVAPVYPWIYTGGIDPYLWEPIPGVQTLDFRPYRVDLTPFAAVLADGNPSTDIQNVQQATTVDSRVSTREGSTVSTREQHFSYPLRIDFSFVVNADGSQTQTTTSEQGELVRESASGGSQEHDRSLENEVRATDTLNFDAAGNFLGPSGSM